MYAESDDGDINQFNVSFMIKVNPRPERWIRELNELSIFRGQNQIVFLKVRVIFGGSSTRWMKRIEFHITASFDSIAKSIKENERMLNKLLISIDDYPTSNSEDSTYKSPLVDSINYSDKLDSVHREIFSIKHDLNGFLMSLLCL
ncbi:hypothetical protein Bhyg_09652 [Pseudolycoriella hygida]|uniref:Uncharacterized protein n=1 Tax=Pseudolycoriella hygida TaxID=35572 RepID=A0A9Q0MRY1_9DIPT|nr:hypothetical protein Bhyg_09652 [Pseudolycoriella hygida]